MELNISTATTDVLIIGGGGAGLRAAIEAREHGADVLLVSQSRVGYGSNTTISGGAFAAAADISRGSSDVNDSPDKHLHDTVSGGYYINDQDLVDMMVQGAEQQVDDLRRFGVKYTRIQESPWIALSLDPGHSRSRMVYGRNSFGTDFTFPMRQCALDKGVNLVEGILITKLLRRGNSVVGAIGVDIRGDVSVFSAPAIILACGGLGQIYSRTDTTTGTTGDGYVLAYDVGAALKDMEFVQFYPTCMGSGTLAVFYECILLDAGGRLLNSEGEDIVAKHGLDDSMLLTRDRLSQAIGLELAGSLGMDGKVFLDLMDVSPTNMDILRLILPKEVRWEEQRCQVAPAVHFQMGGVKVNGKAETSVPGLYAAGEVCAGVHGANRLSGNALTELWVFGTIAGREAVRRAKDGERIPLPSDAIDAEAERLTGMASGGNGETLKELRQSLKEIMWRRAGVIRDDPGLNQGLEEIADLKERFNNISVTGDRQLQRAVKLGNMLTSAEMVCRSALYRRESRGAHYRQDHLGRNDREWLCNVLLTNNGDHMTVNTEPIEWTRLKPQT